MITSMSRERATIFYTLATLLKAGFPLPDALAECIRTTRNEHLKTALTRITQDVLSGRHFHETILNHKNLFPAYIPALIRTGEQSGTLPETLEHIADLLEANEDTRHELISALIYPSLIIISALAAVSFLSITVIPGLEDIFVASGRVLPWPAKFVRQAGWEGAAAALGIVTWFVYVFLKNPSEMNRMGHGFLTKSIPLLKELAVASETALWTGILARLLKGGVPLAEALSVISETIPGTSIASALGKTRALIEQGLSPGDAFSQIPGFPDLARRLVMAGDRSGDFMGALAKTSALYRSRHKKALRMLTVLAEPLAVIFAGLIVLVVALSIMLPMAELGGLV